ncbi:hypothetical protein KM043_010950 [Ampulex compressa]|nr:hypothetical protein KM043_010950 [Ampulex compressa]
MEMSPPKERAGREEIGKRLGRRRPGERSIPRRNWKLISCRQDASESRGNSIFPESGKRRPKAAPTGLSPRVPRHKLKSTKEPAAALFMPFCQPTDGGRLYTP